MKKTSILILLTALALCSCMKSESESANASEKRYFDAWIEYHHPELVGKAIYPGVYILDDVPGTGEVIGDMDNTPYLRMDYTIRTLDSTITTSSKEIIARQRGLYYQEYYYGPEIFQRKEEAMYIGLDVAINDMRLGGRRTFIVPGWLLSTTRYGSESEYLANVTGNVHAIYEIEPRERISDIDSWETDSLKRYMIRAFGYTPQQVETDTLKAGFYKVQLKKPVTDTIFPKDTTFYINYIGRRLDGQVFDTTIADTAKMYGLYSSSKTYTPLAVVMNETYTSITLSSSNVIDGFAYLLNTMGPYEKAIGIFHSKYGYTTSGSGMSIPAYCPLQFEVEAVDKPQ